MNSKRTTGTGIHHWIEQSSNIIQFDGQSIDEILENSEPDPIPIISKGLLDPSSILMITAPPKTGKSILALNFALSLIKHQNWFDFEITNFANVAYFQAEMKDYRLKKRLETMTRNKKIRHRGQLFVTSPVSFDMLNEEYFKSIRHFVFESETNVLIFDPLISYHNVDENSNVQMQRVMEQFRDLVNITNVSIILVHHSRKTYGTNIAGGQNARGASAIFGALDGLIEMRKNTKDVKLYFDLRYDGAPEEMVLRLNPETLWFEKLDNSAIHARAILDILTENTNTGEMSKSEVVKAITENYDVSNKTAYNWLADAAKSKLIRINKSQKKGHQYLVTIAKNKHQN